jgi:flagellar basal-body rod modification protein FlgD
MADPIGSTTGAAGAAGANATPRSAGNGFAALAERDTFLRLLVAQVQNQDPLNPQEPIEFVSQLAQFSQLETLLSMRTSLESIEQDLNTPEAPVDDSGAVEGDGV